MIPDSLVQLGKPRKANDWQMTASQPRSCCIVEHLWLSLASPTNKCRPDSNRFITAMLCPIANKSSIGRVERTAKTAYTAPTRSEESSTWLGDEWTFCRTLSLWKYQIPETFFAHPTHALNEPNLLYTVDMDSRSHNIRSALCHG